MKLLLDANPSPRLVGLVFDVFPDTAHVFSLGLGPDDQAIWSFAKDNGYMILSNDSDFYRFSVLRCVPPKVTWLRVGNDGTAAIARLIRTRATDLQSFATSPTDALLILGKP